jgi:hypothetical protein
MVDQLRSAAFLINTPTGPVRQSCDDQRAFAPVVVQLRAIDPEMDAVLLAPADAIARNDQIALWPTITRRSRLECRFD